MGMHTLTRQCKGSAPQRRRKNVDKGVWPVPMGRCYWANVAAELLAVGHGEHRASRHTRGRLYHRST